MSKKAGKTRVSHLSGLLVFSLRNVYNSRLENPTRQKRRHRFAAASRPHYRQEVAAMRMGVLIALCGGVLMFAFGAYREGSNIQASIMLAIVFVIMGLALWFNSKTKGK